MKIRELFGRGHLFSFELFPPKTDAGSARLERTIAELAELHPSYISVTYGAGGSTRDRTIEIVTRIQKTTGIIAMAHLTCVGASRDEIGQVVQRLVAGGVENIIALRGDPPAGAEKFETAPGGFSHAADLAAFIRQQHGHLLSLAGAGYPEGHPECRDLATDMVHLKNKVDAGVDFIVTQLFFDNRHYFDFVDRARAAGITVPIVAGIMPILNAAQIERFTKMCGATIPPSLQADLDRLRDDGAAVERLGVDHAYAQCVDLLKRGAPGIHFYTLNQSSATRNILMRLQAAGLG